MTAVVSRRRFLQGSAVTIIAASQFAKAQDWFAPALVYPALKIGNVNSLKPGSAVNFSYPDEASQGILLQLTEQAIGGVGRGRDIVAYSAACTHMGCGVQYKSGRLQCPCHYSLYDPAKNGQVYQGVASSYLPQIPLRVAANGDIYAIAVEGLIWGRAVNLLKGA